MPDIDYLFAYDDWANRETLASLTRAQSPPQSALSRMAHIIAAEWLWYARITGVPATMAVWPELPLEKCDEHLDALAATWSKFVAELPPGGFDRSISYTNSKGERFDSRVEDILLHVVFHSTYHRGQIAGEMRKAGFEPAYTDFIHAVRTGALKRKK
jgi:uncharacterized damage-inducible protein DinB